MTGARSEAKASGFHRPDAAGRGQAAGRRSYPQAVVFDCDGLLLDTETAWSRAEARVYERHGAEFTLEHKRELVGTSGAAAAATIERHLGLPAGAGPAMQEELHEMVLAEVRRSAPPQPGACELVRALADRGVPLAVASNSPSEIVCAAVRTAGLAGAFAAVVSAEEVGRPKPAPDTYLEACRRLAADPARSVALEDSPTGVAAAGAAGMFVIGVPSLPGVVLPGADIVALSLAAPEVRDAVGLRLAA